MKLFLKIVPNEFKNESRDMRELSVVKNFKTDIIVMAKGEYNHIDSTSEYLIHRRSTRPLGNYKWLAKINRIISVFTWAYYAKKLRVDYISCHDLIALFIGWLSTLCTPKKKKPLLVYDSHEFEIGRNIGGKRSKITMFIIHKAEKFLIKKCAFSIMVNESIANEVKRIHKFKELPVVVRNIPNYWVIEDDICMKKRKEICKELMISEDTFIVMYHGGVIGGRGIENLLKAVARNKSFVAIILGNGEKNYIKCLKQMVKELQITKRVLFHQAVPVLDLWQYVGAADVGVILAPNTCMNHYYMLPNKLFENIQSLTPIIGSNFPEISRIVNKYDIGLLVNPENVEEIVEAIEKMRTNKEVYQKFKDNLKKAKEVLCWENECKVLEKSYRKILR